jgi:uncharacterized protein YggT (Ycf19 family)
MRQILLIATNILIVALFIYSKLTPYKDRLSDQYLKVFTFFDRIFTPILKLLRKIVGTTRVGNGIMVDMSQVILLILLLILLKFI